MPGIEYPSSRPWPRSSSNARPTILSIPSEKKKFFSNFINIFKFSNYYDDTVENKSLEWLLEVENAGELIKYICSYIGPENILQEEEIKYLELTATGDLVNQIQNDESSTLDEVTYESVALLEEEILELDTFMAVVSNQDEILRANSKSLEDDLLRECEKSKSVQQQLGLEKAEHACNKASKKVDVARTKFMECFLSLNSILKNSQTDQRDHLELLSHMPIEDLLKKYDRSIQHIDLITSQNCDEQETSAGVNESSIQFISSKTKPLLRKTLERLTLWDDILTTAKRELVLAHLEKHEQLTGVGYIELLTHNIKTGIFQPTRNKLMVQKVNLDDSIEELHGNLLKTDLDVDIKRFVDARYSQIFHKIRVKVRLHQRDRLERWKALLKCVEGRAYGCHLLLVLLAGEKGKLIDIVQLLREYAGSVCDEFQRLTERIDKMETIHRSEADGIRDGDELSFTKMLTSLLATSETFSTDQELLDAFKRLEDSIRSDEQTLLHTSFQATDETLTKNLRSLQEMVKHLFSGPTKKPVIVDTDLSHQLYDIDVLVKGLRETLCAVLEECAVVKASKMSNKYLRARRLLWVYFLTDREKIPGLIAEMEHALRKKKLDKQDKH